MTTVETGALGSAEPLGAGVGSLDSLGDWLGDWLGERLGVVLGSLRGLGRAGGAGDGSVLHHLVHGPAEGRARACAPGGEGRGRAARDLFDQGEGASSPTTTATVPATTIRLRHPGPSTRRSRGWTSPTRRPAAYGRVATAQRVGVRRAAHGADDAAEGHARQVPVTPSQGRRTPP
ncbi:MAG: hypothetical protein R2734_20280 [Nocardioides sp.]